MRRQALILLLAGAAGCAGKATVQPISPPSPQVATTAPRTAPAPAAAPASGPAPLVPLDSSQVSEIARHVTLSADSAADEAVLDQLAVAHPEGVTDDDLPAVPVSWDIDVTTWGDHERVQFYLSFFEEQAHPRFQIWLERMPMYEPMIRQKLQAANMPTDLVYLALIESGFSNSAMSRTRAVGMWQFMPRTGKEYGLRIDSWVDERRDPVKATSAALEFLSDLYQRFGSYYLAAAAYNAGGGKISRGLKRIGATPTVSTASASLAPDGEEAMTEDEDEGFSDADFFKLYDTRHIRRETKDYVPKLIAAARIAKEPQRYGFMPVSPTAPYPLDSLVVSGMTGLDVVAQLADTSLTYIREINPQYLRLATPPGTTSVVRVPSGRQASTQAAYQALPAAERVTFAYYTAKKGDTPTKIAQHYGVPVGLIYEANPWVRSGYAVKAGRQVVVPTGGSASVVVARQVSTVRESPDRGSSRGGYHTVRKGETLGGIARRYHVSTSQLKAWNGMSGTTVRVGQKLRVSPGRSRSSGTQLASRDHAKGGGSTVGNTTTVRHRVRSGETLSGIARQYGVSVASIKQVNNLSGGLKSGTTIRIPKKA